jgi:hypothetical protein
VAIVSVGCSADKASWHRKTKLRSGKEIRHASASPKVRSLVEFVISHQAMSQAYFHPMRKLKESTRLFPRYNERTS